MRCTRPGQCLGEGALCKGGETCRSVAGSGQLVHCDEVTGNPVGGARSAWPSARSASRPGVPAGHLYDEKTAGVDGTDDDLADVDGVGRSAAPPATASLVCAEARQCRRIA